MAGWNVYAVCPTCGWRVVAPFGKLFHVHHTVCPHCGTPKEQFDLRVCRWVSTAKWWKPWTWSCGYWEELAETTG